MTWQQKQQSDLRLKQACITKGSFGRHRMALCQIPYCRIDGVSEFLANVPGLQFSFDTGNFVMYHEDEVEAFELFKDKICTVHLKDRGHGKEQPVVICADGEKVCTVPVGDGFIHIKEILLNLKQLGYDGGLIAEMYGHAAENMYDGIRKSVKWIRETWKGL